MSEHQQEWQIGEVISGSYQVKAKLGEGGMGIVYQVYSRKWNRDLAVKSPKPELFAKPGSRESFLREAETWVSLRRHPNVVSCHYVHTIGGIPRIFADYISGGTLTEWIRSRRLYEGGHERALTRMLDVAIQFAWGLHAAHEQGLIHQDIKPANVMMTPDGTPKVTDFGLAKPRALAGEGGVWTDGQSRSILVSAGGMTPAYCSPEQAMQRPLSRKTDMWSWGVSILEMFVGKVTWGAGIVAQEALAKRQRQAAVIPVMPPELVMLLARCFQLQPEDRPATMLANSKPVMSTWWGARIPVRCLTLLPSTQLNL
jgi:serine/threonine protein kinase